MVSSKVYWILTRIQAIYCLIVWYYDSVTSHISISFNTDSFTLRPSWDIGRWQQSSKVFCPSLFSSSLQLYPVLFVFVRKFLLRVFLGRRLFLFPCGLHVSTCLVIFDAGFRSVWSIHPHCLLLISSPASSWCVFSHMPLLLMEFGQRIWRILLRQLFIKVCTFLVAVLVDLHVSAPYSSRCSWAV